MYSAHDVTLAAFLSALGVFNGIQPPYAAMVLLELHEPRPDHFVVQVKPRPPLRPATSAPHSIERKTKKNGLIRLGIRTENNFSQFFWGFREILELGHQS